MQREPSTPGARSRVAVLVTAAATVALVLPAGAFASGLALADSQLASAPLVAAAAAAVPVLTQVNGVQLESVGFGSQGGGTKLEVFGSGFDDVTSVTVGGRRAEFRRLSDGYGTIVTPPGPAGIAEITLHSAAGASAPSVVSKFRYTEGAVAPRYVVSGVDTPITITGLDLSQATGVTFNGEPAGEFRKVDARTVVATPELAYMDLSVRVQFADGSEMLVGDEIRFVSDTEPTALSAAPVAGSLDGGTVVTIEGLNLDRLREVRIAQAPVPWTAVSPTQIRVVTPPSTTAKVATIQLFGKDGGIDNTTDFTYLAPPRVTLSRIVPGAVRARTAASVVVLGSRLSTVTAVNVNGAKVRPLVKAPGFLVFSSPKLAVGSYPVTVSVGEATTSTAGAPVLRATVR